MEGKEVMEATACSGLLLREAEAVRELMTFSFEDVPVECVQTLQVSPCMNLKDRFGELES